PGAIPFAPAAVVLHVEPARRVGMAGNLVDALTELGIRVGREAGADAVVGRLERLAAILAEVMAAGRDAEMGAASVAQDRVHAQAAGSGVPFARVLVVADAADQFPAVAAVGGAEERGRFDAAPEFLLGVARFQRPDVGERPAVLLGEGGGGFGLLEFVAEVVRDEDLHAEEGVAAGSIKARRAARIDEGGIDCDAGAERAAQVETAAVPGRLGDEETLLGADAENDAVRHVQPPETAGMMVMTSPDTSA